ncbi:hypothetical protein T484DRAFT_1784042, partial [Baffinella frigidus]
GEEWKEQLQRHVRDGGGHFSSNLDASVTSNLDTTGDEMDVKPRLVVAMPPDGPLANRGNGSKSGNGSKG